MKNAKGNKKSDAKKTTKTSAKAKVEKGKRLSNEALMDQLVTSKATDKVIKKAFLARYDGQTPEYIAKRIKIYQQISFKRAGLDKHGNKAQAKSSTEKPAKVTQASGKKVVVEEKTAVNA